MKKYLYILPANENALNWSTDFINQTYKQLKNRGHKVFILIPYKVVGLYSWLNYLIGNQIMGYNVICIPHILFFKFPLLRRFSEVFFLKVLKLIIDACNCFVRPVGFWIYYFPDLYKHISDLINNDVKIIYDCVDYYTSSDIDINNIIRKYEFDLIKKSYIVTVNSKTLLKLHEKKRKQIHLVPQGFRLGDFERYSNNRVKRNSKKKVVIGYLGGLSYRLDFNLLIELVKRNSGWKFHLIGPIFYEPEDKYYNTRENLRQLLSFTNVVHDTAKNKKGLPKIIESFTIAIIPYYIRDKFNKYCYPMKLFEYFYMGKPVISTPIEELKRFPKFVKIGKTAQEWEKHIKSLLSKPWPTIYQEEQRKLAIENSWENKIEAISKIIETKYTRSS